MSAVPVTQMAREHQAWLLFVHQLQNVGIVINEEDALHAAVTLWGEELARLRAHQDEETLHRAYSEALARYGQHIGFLPSTYGFVG